MKQRYLYHTLSTLLLGAALSACNSDELTVADTLAATVHPDGPIELQAGITEGGSAATTRAPAAETYHTSHQTLTGGTKLALRISGTWTGHSPDTVVQTTTATVGAETVANSKHNSLTCNPVRYWDEYGTADPSNASTGRTAGLTIYGAAVNGKDTIPTITEGQWTSGLPWKIAADQTASGWTVADKDLLISNNVKSSTGLTTEISNDGTYKFAERGSGKLLEFRHALSKITVNLKAGAGFSGSAFASTPPVVTLTSNTTGSSSLTEWPFTTGTVNVTTGGISSQNNHAAIIMGTAASAATGYDVTKEALVIPGSEFASDAAIIARINADGNIYYITALQIRTAINAAHASDGAYATEAGKNYIIKVTVNKTDIVVTATVAGWTDVNSEEVAPVINVSGNLGTGTTGLNNTFSLYRSTSTDDGYGTGTKVGTYYGKESAVTYSEGNWSMSPTLYWPDHNTHYQFRGVFPATGTGTGPVAYPRVEDGTVTTADCQVIKVENATYTTGTFPSDLMIGRPEGLESTNCSSTEHTPVNLNNDGICATEGTINLNFRYMMSQVEVYVETSGASDADQVDLSKVKVELVNIRTTGDVKLGSREVVATGTPTYYTLGDFSNSTYTYDGGTKKGHCEIKAIVPQQLTYTTAQADVNVKFRITITNDNGTPDDPSDDHTDIYYADVAPIKKQGSTDYVAAYVSGEPGTWSWESGHHYIYNLKLTKTDVNVNATLSPWETVNASEDVWF